jgi:hypothetical protein
MLTAVVALWDLLRVREATSTGTSHETASVRLLLQTWMASWALQDDSDRLRAYELAAFCNHDKLLGTGRSLFSWASQRRARPQNALPYLSHTHPHIPHLASQLVGFHRARGVVGLEVGTDMYTLNFVSARQISSPAHQKPGSAQQLGGENLSSCMLLSHCSANKLCCTEA